MDYRPATIRLLQIIVTEDHEPSSPPHESLRTYQLLICPAIPLGLGLTIRLFLAIDPPPDVQFLPTLTTPAVTARMLPILGTIVAAKVRFRRGLIEFIVRNEMAASRDQWVLVRTVIAPGMTVCEECWQQIVQDYVGEKVSRTSSP